MDDVPEARWLDLFNVKYLITDKVGDTWQGGVFFDRQHPVTLNSDNPIVEVGYLPDYVPTEIWIMSTGATGRVDVEFINSGQTKMIPEQVGEELFRVAWDESEALSKVKFLACEHAGENRTRKQTELVG